MLDLENNLVLENVNVIMLTQVTLYNSAICFATKIRKKSEVFLFKKGFQMRRTKCTALVKKVLGPHFMDELRDDIKETPFSLLVDESTDVSTSKLLGVRHNLLLTDDEANRVDIFGIGRDPSWGCHYS